MERYICIHGHFYQPPRENPWLEAIELQDSAYPYHDWNERVTAEAYAPNAASRILDDRGRIVRIVNNYSRISFDFGPTLLEWLEPNAPDVYQAVLEADRESARRFSGHGSAMAQAYNHIILPLANPRDKRTQVRWGIADFVKRFGRRPEGMWLPETAVDLESLEILVDHGIRFTVLAPNQARRVRAIGARSWDDVTGSKIDPTRPYVQRLPSGREIAIFFYDGPVSRAVAFEGLLRNGEEFARRLTGLFSDQRSWPQLAHIATDGETYGHHHRHGDMALAYALEQIESRGLARLTNYGEYLEMHPPTHEVEIQEDTSWSCSHGVERWTADCGCRTGGQPEWSQAWRAPLRAALDWLRDSLEPVYERNAAELLRDPWAARDDYIDVILDRSNESVDAFLSRHAVRPLDPAETVRVLKLMELQRHLQLMYTSCGWFFNELSGIETVQVIQYAGRAVQLAQELFGNGTEEEFLKWIEQARSNIPERGDGRTIYEACVRPAMVNLEQVEAHYAVTSLFEPSGRRARVYCYTVELEDRTVEQAGNATLFVGRTRVASEITRESEELTFGVVHFGDQNLAAGVRRFQDQETYRAMVRDLTGPFARADLPTVIRHLDRHFPGSTYSLKSLFQNEQRRILDRILESTLSAVESVYRGVYERHAPLLRFLEDLKMPLPSAFKLAADFVLNTDLKRAFGDGEFDVERAAELLEEAKGAGVSLESEGLSYALQTTMERLSRRFEHAPLDLVHLQRLEGATALARSLPFEIDLWVPQNVFYSVLKRTYPEVRERAAAGEEAAAEWVRHFRALGDKLAVAVG